MRAGVLLLAMVFASSAAAQNVEQDIAEFSRRLSEIQAALNPPEEMTDTRSMFAKSVKVDPKRYEGALDKAMETIGWMKGTSLEYTGMTVSVTIPPQIDIHFTVAPDAATP